MQVDALHKTFNDGSTVAVDDVSFEVPDSRIVSLLGPSGCGKTTTLRCIAGVETPDSGTITIKDTVYSDRINANPEERDIGMVYQNYAIWPHLTVYENVEYPLRFATDIPKSEYEDRVVETLELVQIPELADKPATDLSGGQQQRTSLARAIVHDPELVLLDEPLSNLDVKLRTTMRKEIQRLQYELDLKMIYVTHDQEEAFFLSDEVIVMRDGRIVEKGAPEDLYVSPETGFTRGFVGRWNELSGVVDGDTLTTDLFDAPFDPDQAAVSSGRCVCYIRPRDIEVGHRSDDGHVNLTGTVISGGILGELYEFTLSFGDGTSGQELSVMTLDYLQFDLGDEVDVAFPADRVQIYAR